MELLEYLDIQPFQRTIAVVGAGGKTSLIFALAAAFAQKGKSVCVTTSTKMFAVPDTKIYVQKGTFLGTFPEKIGPLPEMEYQKLRQNYDIVLVEADGARHLPMKVPGEFEPVIPKDADLVIGILGASAIGKPLKETCFRWQLAQKILRCDENHIVTLVDLLFLLQSEQGQKKAVFCDYRMMVGQGDLLKEALPEKYYLWTRK